MPVNAERPAPCAFAKVENPKLAEVLQKYGVASPNMVETQYGWKIQLDERSLVVCIYPGKNTGMGAAELDGNGMCPHPNALWEHVEHLGNLYEPQDNERLLVYYYRGPGVSEIGRLRFGRGAKFYSAQMDSEQIGYWHVLMNIAEKKAARDDADKTYPWDIPGSAVEKERKKKESNDKEDRTGPIILLITSEKIGDAEKLRRKAPTSPS